MEQEPFIINMAIVGGNMDCKELLDEIAPTTKDTYSRIIAVADPDPNSPGMTLAKKQGLITLTDYHDLYDSQHNISLIIITNPDRNVFDDIRATRPSHIRIMSYRVFEIFWKAIRLDEKRLRDQNNEMKTILDGIQDFILVIKPDMEIAEVNAAFLEKMHFDREEIIGRKCYEILQGLDEPCNQVEWLCPLQEVIRNKSFSRNIVRRINRDGKLRYIDVSVFPIWEKDGKISKFIEISRDVTKQKSEEEEITRRLEIMVAERTQQLKETHEKLLHQDKMASLGKLAASVVHEINNPMAGMLNLIMLMKRITKEGNVTEKELKNFGDYLSLMESETWRISRIISNLLAFSRQSHLEFKPVNLNRVLDVTMFMNSNLLKIHGIKVNRHLVSELPEIIGSEDQLQQVFMNIVSNAAESMEFSTTRILTIDTDYSLENNRIAIYFSDTGVGIPKENMLRLFDPFFTTKTKGKGVGLGLSLAYGIVKEHGGSIEADSEQGKGTTFKVMLPIKHSQEAHKTEDECQKPEF